MIPKSQMTEEDIKLNFITPAIQSKGWLNHITMETQITDGKVNLRGNLVVREKPKRVDYLLYIKSNQPIAVVEAKDNHHTVSHGLQQAKEYAIKLDLPFAYSSNGDGFQEYDFLTGQERTLTLDAFPTREELIARYYREMNRGSGITEMEKKVQDQPFYISESTFETRFYQRIAVDRTLDAIALGKQRLLLVMATGTGKTYTAFQIVYRLIRSGLKSRILYLADRNILVDQSIGQDFKPLEETIHKIDYGKDIKVAGKILSHEVYFSLYHQLIGDNDEKRYAELFRPGFFDLVIVDECHRGSAREDSRWREILDYFSSATQIGMTATPRETRYVSNLSYFGEPVYTYSLNEGIEDGFLANFKVIEPRMNISDGWRPLKGQKDIYGVEIEDRIYNNTDYDYNIIIGDRIREVARNITEYLKSTGRMQKTIVFCADEDAAERMRIELTKLNQDMMRDHPDYVVRITGSDEYGRGKLDYFISVSQDYPVIATTSDLLSTGVDTKTVKVIAIDKNIIRMPGSVFSPYTSITTNILFFGGNGPTRETWFYRLDMPEGYKHFSKTRPMKLEHFQPAMDWWEHREEIELDGFPKAKKFTAQELAEDLGYNLDQCGYPHEEEEILAPMDLIQRYQEERASLNAEIDHVLAEITAKLGGVEA